MKRQSPEQVAAWRRRSKPLKRGKGLKRGKRRPTRTKKRDPDWQQTMVETRAFKQAARRQYVCALCGKGGQFKGKPNPWEAHHVVAKTFLRREGFALWHPDNALRLCEHPCHEHHTLAFNRLPLKVLLGCNIDYAVRLLGEDRAYSYLMRNYTGTDPRVDALIEAGEYTDLEDTA
jgi:hypothetical protein